MTPQLFLNLVLHAFFLLEWVNLLILDECHHASKSHPFSEILLEYHKAAPEKRPKIFGMTAVPAPGLGIGDNYENLKKKVSKFQSLIDAKVNFVEFSFF